MVSFAHGLGWSRRAYSIACGRFRRGGGSYRPGALTDVLLQLATAIAGIVTIIGRMRATSRIS